MSFNDRYIEQIRHTTFGRDMRNPIVRAVGRIESVQQHRLDDISELHGERVQSATTSAIPEKDGYFQLNLTRANGK